MAVNRVDEPIQSSGEHTPDSSHNSGVVVMNTKHEERTASFFAQPGILAGEFSCSLNFPQLFDNLSLISLVKVHSDEQKYYKLRLYILVLLMVHSESAILLVLIAW